MKIENKKLIGIVAIVMLTLAAAVGSVSMAAGKAEAEREIKTEYEIKNEHEDEIEAIAAGQAIYEIPALAAVDTKNTVRQAKKDYEEKVREEKLEEERRREEQQKEEQRKEEQELLAALIFCEAGNQPYEGQVAVGAVVMNRVRSDVYPNRISEVIYQSGQFTPAMTGWLDSVLASDGYTSSAMQAAADALAGSNPIGDMLYFDCGGSGYQIGDHFFH